MAKIYVSSTYLDLQDYRAQVEKVIRRMGHLDVAMEYYVAEDTRPVAKCLADVTDCDVYVGIYAWRYGWQPKNDNPDQLSITEMEFQQAEKMGKPCLIFLLSDDAPWPRKHMDKDISKIENLRNKASANHTADYFSSPDELARKIAEAIYKQLPVAVSIPEHNLGMYFDALRKRYNVLALEGLTPPQKEEYLQIQLRSVFVEQSVREDTPPVELPKEVWEKLSREKEIHEEDLPAGITLEEVRKTRETYYQKPSRFVLDALTDSRNKYSIILGDPGSGKSTLARYVMLSLINPALADDKIQKAFEGYLPLLIELRTFAGLCAEDKCETPLEFLEHLGKTEGWGLTQTALHNHMKGDGRAIVIFDGLDEIFEPKLRETITNQIVGFTNAYPKAHVIVTSRILGYRRKILSDAGFIHFTLQDLDENQVEAFITKWYQLAMSDRLDEAKERSERILKSFKDSASIRQLAGNPMLLTIMAIIGKHQELPRERWKLYDHAASVLIQHWDVNKHLKDERIEADFIGEDDKKELLRRLAFRMQSGEGGLAGNYIHREGLQEEFETYLKERYSKAPDQAKVIAEAMIQQFRERNFILSLYGANVFGFVHRAFLEYFCASAFVWKFEKTKEMDIEQLKTDVYGRHWEDQSWHEVLRLICGMIDEKWVGNAIDYLTNIRLSSSIVKEANLTLWNIALAIQCLSEVRNIILIEKVAQKVVSKTFSLIADRKNDELSHFFETTLAPSIALIDNTVIKYDISTWMTKVIKNSFPNQKYYRACSIIAVAYAYSDDDLRVKIVPLIQKKEPWLRFFYVETISRMSKNDTNLEALQAVVEKDEDPVVLRSAVSSLINKYNAENQILSLLKGRVKQDKNANVRSAAVTALAEYYSEDAETLSLLQECVVQDENANVRSTAVLALVKRYREDGQTLPIVQGRAVQDKDWQVRSAAVSALSEYYREDSETLPIVQGRAVQDKDWQVRSAAVSALSEYYREDSETLPLLRERVMQDNDANVRSAAVTALAEYYSGDAETLSLLQERVVQDENANVRSTAVLALVKRYREDGQTLPIVQGRAVQDKDWQVRSAAVSALSEYYREDTRTLPLLRERAIKDESPLPTDERFWEECVREIAIYAITKHWRHHPGTLPLLRERAENDPTPWLRERCKELIAEIEGEKE